MRLLFEVRRRQKLNTNTNYQIAQCAFCLWFVGWEIQKLNTNTNRTVTVDTNTNANYQNPDVAFLLFVVCWQRNSNQFAKTFFLWWCDDVDKMIRWHGVLKIPPTVTLSRGLPLPTEVSTGRAWMGKQFWENLNALKSRVNLNALGVRKFKCSKVRRKYKCSGCEKILIGFFWSLSDWEKAMRSPLLSRRTSDVSPG